MRQTRKSKHWLEVLSGEERKEQERRLVAEAVNAAKEEFREEIATARKSMKADSWCWTTKDVARELEVHEKTVGSWRRRLGLPSKKFGRSVRFRPGDVRRWEAQRKEG
jgi:transposase